MNKFVLMVICLLGGCSMNSVVMHDGGNMARKEIAVVSVLGGDVDKSVSFRLAEVNGRIVPGASNFATYEVQLKPGKHTLKYFVWGDVIMANGERVYADVEHTLVAGHTYVPAVDILAGKKPKIWLVDKGENYPVECNHSLLLTNKYPKESCK